MKKFLFLLLLGVISYGQNLTLTQNTTLPAGNHYYQNIQFNNFCTLTLANNANLFVTNINNNGIITASGSNIIDLSGDFNGSQTVNMGGDVCIRVNGNLNGGNFVGTGVGNVVSVSRNIQNNATPSNVTFLPNSSYSCSPAVQCSNSTTWNGSSWSNGVPNINVNAIISGNLILNYNLDCCNLTINSGASLRVSSNYTLTVNNNISNSGNFVIENNSNLIQNGLRNTNSGNLEIFRNSSALKRLDYTVWSSPVKDQNLKLFSPGTLNDRFYTYGTSTNTYDEVNPLSNNFVNAKGVMIRVPNNHPEVATIWSGKFTGVPNSGVQSVNLIYAGSNKGVNMVGNPYPSPIDVTKFIDGNSKQNENESLIRGTLYFWRKTNNPTQSSFATVTKSGFVRNNSQIGDAGGVNPNGIIRQGQGFFVVALKSGVLQFNNSMRSNNTGNQIFRTGNLSGPKYWLNTTSLDGVFSQSMVTYDSESTLGYDNGMDGDLYSESATSTFTKVGDRKLSIQARGGFNEEDKVNFYVPTRVGTYELNLDPESNLNENRIFIKDNKLNSVTELTSNSYTFEVEDGDVNPRFQVSYRSESLSQDEFDSSNLKVWTSSDRLKISSSESLDSIEVYNLLGQKLYSSNKEFKELDIPVNGKIIILKLTRDNSNYTKKLVVK